MRTMAVMLVVAGLFAVHPLWRLKVDCFISTGGATACFNPQPARGPA